VVTDRRVYDAFGQTIGQTGSTVNAYLFAGEQRDSATGLDYVRARYLNTETGRFQSRDSFQFALSTPITLHRYLYANLNPVTNVDPSGLYTINDGTSAAAINGTLNAVKIQRFFAIRDRLQLVLALANFSFGVASLVSNSLEAVGKVTQTARFPDGSELSLGFAVMKSNAEVGYTVTAGTKSKATKGIGAAGTTSFELGLRRDFKTGKVTVSATAGFGVELAGVFKIGVSSFVEQILDGTGGGSVGVIFEGSISTAATAKFQSNTLVSAALRLTLVPSFATEFRLGLLEQRFADPLYDSRNGNS
jgi:RHS repeat-associated protein